MIPHNQALTAWRVHTAFITWWHCNCHESCLVYVIFVRYHTCLLIVCGCTVLDVRPVYVIGRVWSICMKCYGVFIVMILVSQVRLKLMYNVVCTYVFNVCLCTYDIVLSLWSDQQFVWDVYVRNVWCVSVRIMFCLDSLMRACVCAWYVCMINMCSCCCCCCFGDSLRRVESQLLDVPQEAEQSSHLITANRRRQISDLNHVRSRHPVHFKIDRGSILWKLNDAPEWSALR